jgi:hypothetical protein
MVNLAKAANSARWPSSLFRDCSRRTQTRLSRRLAWVLSQRHMSRNHIFGDIIPPHGGVTPMTSLCEAPFWRHNCQDGQFSIAGSSVNSRSARNGGAELASMLSACKTGELSKICRGQWAVGSGETAAKPLLHSLLAPRCSLLPITYTCVYAISSILGSRARQKQVAKFKKFSAAQVVAGRGDRDSRGPRIWRAGGGWLFGGADFGLTSCYAEWPRLRPLLFRWMERTC